MKICDLSAIITALGGRQALQELLGVGPSAVSNYLARRGKFLLLPLDGGETMLMHLGMSGSVRIHSAAPEIGKHDHMVLSMAEGGPDAPPSWIVFNDPRRFGWIDLFRDDLPGRSNLDSAGSARAGRHLYPPAPASGFPRRAASCHRRLICIDPCRSGDR